MKGFSDGRTRIWITDTGSFQGEVEIENKALAQILTRLLPQSKGPEGAGGGNTSRQRNKGGWHKHRMGLGGFQAS